MIKSIPHLSTTGWMKNPELVIVKLYEYFLLSDYSQSNMYFTKIASLKYILQQNSGTYDVKVAMQRMLYDMYISYYDQVDIIVDIIENDNITSYNINVSAVINEKTYTLTQMLTTDPNNNVTNMDTLLAELYE